MTNKVERNYGKLYEPDSANTFIWHVIPKGYKPGTATSYERTGSCDSQSLTSRGFTLVNSVQMGRYDENGYYHTYKPGVENCFPGKYVQVLKGEDAIDAKNQYERNKINVRWAAKEGKALKV